MAQHRGLYSLIRFCPDLARGEAVNIGVALFAENPRLLLCGIDPYRSKARSWFGLDSEQYDWLKIQSAALETRFSNEVDRIRSAEEFHVFAQTRANALQMTQPRFVAFDDSEKCLSGLLDDLVRSKKSVHAAATPSDADLGRFRERMLEGRLGQVVLPDVHIPVLGQLDEIDNTYAYLNGVPNFVKPVRVEGTRRSFSRAHTLAHRWRIASTEGQAEGMNLACVVLESDDHVSGSYLNTVKKILHGERIRVIGRSEIQGLVREIEESAREGVSERLPWLRQSG